MCPALAHTLFERRTARPRFRLGEKENRKKARDEYHTRGAKRPIDTQKSCCVHKNNISPTGAEQITTARLKRRASRSVQKRVLSNCSNSKLAYHLYDLHIGRMAASRRRMVKKRVSPINLKMPAVMCVCRQRRRYATTAVFTGVVDVLSTPIPLLESTPKVPKPASLAIRSRIQLTLHATRRARHGASRLVRAICSVSMKT